MPRTQAGPEPLCKWPIGYDTQGERTHAPHGARSHHRLQQRGHATHAQWRARLRSLPIRMLTRLMVVMPRAWARPRLLCTRPIRCDMQSERSHAPCGTRSDAGCGKPARRRSAGSGMVLTQPLTRLMMARRRTQATPKQLCTWSAEPGTESGRSRTPRGAQSDGGREPLANGQTFHRRCPSHVAASVQCRLKVERLQMIE